MSSILTENIYRLLVEGATGYALILLDPEGNILTWNSGAERILGWREDEVIGRPAHFVFSRGDATTSILERKLELAASAGQARDLRWHMRKDDSRFYADGLIEAVRSDDGKLIGFVKILRDATDVKRGQDALLASEAELRDAQKRLASALAAGSMATWTLDIVNDRIVGDDNLNRLFSVDPEATPGGELSLYQKAIHPDDLPRVSAKIREAIANGADYECEYRVVMPDRSHRWLIARGKVERDGKGAALSMPGVVVDISEQMKHRQQERFVAELAEQARLLTDPSEVIAAAVEAIGKFFGVDRCAFADIDVIADTCTIPFDYCANESVASIVSTFPISGFGEYLIREFEAGRTVCIDDVNLEPVRMPPPVLIAYQSIGCRAFIAAPVLHSAKLMSVIALHNATPRHWDISEVELLQMVTERTWLTVEVLRQDRALAKAEAQSRVVAEREALIGRIALALRSSVEPNVVLEIAVRELGQALGVNHCYVAAYDQKNDTATIKPEWHAPGQIDLKGTYRLSDFAANHDSRFKQGLTQVLCDTRQDLGFRNLGIQAILRVPLVAGESLAALVVAMSDGIRSWTPDEISFVELVAAQTQIALREARLRSKEQAIAHDLQAALQPPVPKHLPNLSLGSFTKAALDESSIGGDFLDVFEVSSRKIAMVIADVSGKGLLAAAQLAMVRNSLRTTLYLYGEAAASANTLNRIITSNKLLVGFVTVFVGIYDSASGEITYACCGHPPGLVRRLGGSVEELKNTGLPLGVDEKAEYGELSVTLERGESLFLYTDGLSEAGRTRDDMLDVQGLINLVKDIPETLDAQQAAEKIVEQVNEYADGVFHDDVAVLFAVRE